jgi:kynurenine formamidase
MSQSKGNWGRWGAEDERGALNLITPEMVRDAAQACRTGTVYPLSIPIQRTGIPNFEYRGIPQRLTLVNRDDEHLSRTNGGVPGLGSNEDMLMFAAHTGTHMDALGHVYSDNKLYNGFPNDEVAPYEGAARCGIDKIGAVVGRGVLIDVATAKGVSDLEPGYIITRDDLVEALTAQNTELSPGDLVLIRTGWMEAYMAGNRDLVPQPGIGIDAAKFLLENDVSVIGADNAAVEAMPFDQDTYLGVHVVTLVEHGVHLVENLNLETLAADGCYEFLLNIGPLNVTGGTGSPVTPIAIG